MENTRGKYNVAAVIEWIIAFVFTFFVVSFAVDFVPALRSRQGHTEATQIGMAEDPAGYMDEAATPAGGRYYAAAPNGYTNGAMNGGAHKPAQPVAPARNF